MKKKLIMLASAMVLLVLLPACQKLFTFSPLSGFQRDPADMNAAQQVTYAEDLIDNGTPAEMLAALPLIEAQVAADPTNTDLILLAADLALGGSGLEVGLSEAIAAFAANPSDPPTPADINLIIAAMDAAALQTAADYVADAVALDPDSVNPQQYVNAALAIVIADSGGDITSITFDGSYPNYGLVTGYLTASGMTPADFAAMMGM